MQEFEKKLPGHGTNYSQNYVHSPICIYEIHPISRNCFNLNPSKNQRSAGTAYHAHR